MECITWGIFFVDYGAAFWAHPQLSDNGDLLACMPLVDEGRESQAVHNASALDVSGLMKYRVARVQHPEEKRLEIEVVGCVTGAPHF